MSLTISAERASVLSKSSTHSSATPTSRAIGLNQGVRAILAQPRGTYNLPAQNNVKLRLDKDFPVGSSGHNRLRLSFDIQNVFNVDTPVNIRNNSSQADYYNGAAGILNVVQPRQGQIGIRYEF